MLRGVADQGRQVGLVPRCDDAEGIDLEETGVGVVRRALERLEEQVAFDQAEKVVMDSCALFVHGRG